MDQRHHVTEFTRENCRVIGEEIEKALAILADRLNLSIRRGRGRFTSTNFALKLELSVKTKLGQVVTREAQDYTRGCHLYSMKPEWLGELFKTDNGIWKLVGLRSRARSFPVLAERGDGTKFKFRASAVIQAFKNAEGRP